MINNENMQDFPLWIDEKTLSKEWLNQKTGLDCQSCEVDNLNDELKGMSGARLIKLKIVLKNDTEIKVVIKQVLGVSAETSKALGLVREALFYSNFAKELKTRVPITYYAYGDEQTG